MRSNVLSIKQFNYMAIYTTYYDNLHQLNLDSYMPIQVANTNKSGIAMFKFSAVVPNWHRIVEPYKKGRITQTEYEQLYFEQLDANQDTVQSTMQSYVDMANACEQDILLCCYEPKNKFCHRHLLAKWLHNAFGYDINEL